MIYEPIKDSKEFNSQAIHFELLPQKNASNENVNYKNLQNAQIVLAKVIVKYGNKYLPLFHRIENELKEVEKRQILLERARQIAQDNR